jgi:anaerobic magnesium-protoporphyrin IX monomethyl ester cyclase
MRVVLTHAYYLEEDPVEKRIMKPYVPLGILYIASYLEKNQIQNDFFDSTFSSFEAQCSYLLEIKPRIVGIYVNLMTRLNVLRLIKFIRSKQELLETTIILGGPEVTHSAENFVKAGADFIVSGEGEETMLELCREILTGTRQFDVITGISYHNGKEYVKNAPRANMRDLTALPEPAREKVNMEAYFSAWKSKHGQSAVSVSTMRGCPYTCKWCSRAVYGKSYRRRNPVQVVDELEKLCGAYTFDTIWFVDDVFTISHSWLQEFHDEIVKRKLEIRYECITRADRMNEEVIGLLKHSGCFRVWIGAESGSQKIIDAMDRRVEVQQVREMIQSSRKAGLQAGTFIMVGYPGETESDLRETLHHLKVADPDHYTITVAYPIRGTPLYEEVQPYFLKSPGWDEGSDRQLDFSRTYPRAYYRYAVSWISNEVALHKNRISKGPLLDRARHMVKSAAARGGMIYHKISA